VEFDKKRFGAMLREARIERGQSQKMMAADMGVSYTYISHLEAGRRTPTVEMFVRLCAQSEMDPTDILGACCAPC